MLMPRPGLLFLDLTLLVVSGARMLEAIRSDPQFKDLVVIVLSGSPDAQEQAREGILGAQGCLDKSIPLWEFFHTIHKLLNTLWI